MNNEREKQGIAKRKDRKACLVPVGKEQFGFYKELEMRRYKYLCHEKLTRKEWKQCEECEQCIGMSYSYCDWSESIKKKYGTCDIIQLMEFDKYLELCIRKKKISEDASNILYAALASSALAVVFNNLVVEYAESVGNWGNIVIILVFWISICAIIMTIVNAVFSPIRQNSLERNMYKDYQSVIKEMIESKKEQLQKSE